MKNIFKILVFLIILSLFIFLAHNLNLGQVFEKFRFWVKGAGFLGIFVYILFYALAVTVLFPGSVLTIAAGALFGSLWGIVIVSIASTLGAGLSFLIARYFARGLVSEWLKKQEKFRKLDELTQSKGEIIVAITRLIPLFPYTLLNYGFGLTKISFKTYIFWSWLCMFPGIVLYVVGTDAVIESVINGKIQLSHVVIVVVFLAVIVVAAKYSKHVLRGKNNEE